MTFSCDKSLERKRAGTVASFRRITCKTLFLVQYDHFAVANFLGLHFFHYPYFLFKFKSLLIQKNYQIEFFLFELGCHDMSLFEANIETKKGIKNSSEKNETKTYSRIFIEFCSSLTLLSFGLLLLAFAPLAYDQLLPPLLDIGNSLLPPFWAYLRGGNN